MRRCLRGGGDTASRGDGNATGAGMDRLGGSGIKSSLDGKYSAVTISSGIGLCSAHTDSFTWQVLSSGPPQLLVQLRTGDRFRVQRSGLLRFGQEDSEVQEGFRWEDAEVRMFRAFAKK